MIPAKLWIAAALFRRRFRILCGKFPVMSLLPVLGRRLTKLRRFLLLFRSLKRLRHYELTPD